MFIFIVYWENNVRYVKSNYISIGKTLILEASVKTLSQKENTKVHFVNALGKTLSGGLVISNVLFTYFEQIIKLMADIRRNQMIFWMSLAGLKAFLISKMIC